MTTTQHSFQKRISYRGQIENLLTEVAKDYGFGKYKTHKVVGVGYEDFNITLETDKCKYFLKFFADFRDESGCQRYVNIMLAALKQGASHPKLFESNQGYLHKIQTDEGLVRLVALEYIKGSTFFDLKQKPTSEERDFLVRQASLINSVDIQPVFVYDSWAVVNFSNEFKKIRNHLSDEDIELIEPLEKEFALVGIENLPHCFVHGDIIDTNVIRAHDDKLYILDFSVSNVYPRIQELAVMLCDILFSSSKEEFHKTYIRTLKVYQERVKLENKEIEVLPLCVKVAHAMHVIGSASSVIEDGDSEENYHWMQMGREGLRFFKEF